MIAQAGSEGPLECTSQAIGEIEPGRSDYTPVGDAQHSSGIAALIPRLVASTYNQPRAPMV